VTFTVKNTGSRVGSEIAEVYAALPSGLGEPPKRLVGWEKVALQPGQSQQVSVSIAPKLLSTWDATRHAWKLKPRFDFSNSRNPRQRWVSAIFGAIM
jgi:beta-glucosidase